MRTYGKALQILFISSSAEDLSRLHSALKSGGAKPHIETLESEDEFRAALAKTDSKLQPDAVICAIDVPGLPIDAALRILGENSRDLPFILFAEDIDPEAVAAALKAGADNYVSHSGEARLYSVIESEKKEMRARGLRRQTEQKLVEDEDRYRAITESAFDLVCEIDGEGNYLYFSPNYLQLLGYSSGELLGHPVFDLVHPDDAERVIQEYTAAVSGLRTGQVSYRYRGRDDEYHWFESTLRAIRSAGDRRVVKISRDITSQKRHERELASLISLARTLNAQTQLAGLAGELKEGLRDLLPFDSILLALREETFGEAADSVELFQTPDGEGSVRITRSGDADHPIWEALDRDAVRLVNDSHAMVGSGGARLRAFLSVPLRIDNQNWGLLQFDSLHPYVFNEEHARLASMIAEQVAVAARQTQLLSQARAAREKFRNLVTDVEAIVWEADPVNAHLTFISPQVESWLGYAPERLIYDVELWRNLIHPEDRDRVVAETKRAVAAGEDFQLDYRVVAADESVLWLRNLINVEMRESAGGERNAVKLTGVAIDITERKRAEASLWESNAVLSATQEAVADGICLVDERGAVVTFNARFRQMWRIPQELVDEVRDRRQLMGCVLTALSQPEEFVDKMNFLREHPGACSRDEVSLKDGQIFERYSAPAVSPDGRSFGRVWTFSDISERKRYEQQLAYQAFHDPLTDLPNRTLFIDRVNHAMSHLGRVYPAIAVLFLDLDRFKVVNDSMGHAVGDWLLKEVAERLQRCMRPGDTAARFGGDEFTLLLENIGDVNDASLVSERILDALNTPFIVEGRELYVTTSIGIAVTSARDDRADDLLRNADVAMYRAKNKGKARYEIFDMKMSAVALEKLQMEIELRQAVKWEQLKLDYQPLIDLESDKIVGVEALVRWHHPQRGLISPGDFIPIAEESGMIVSIGRWVLREACAQACRWQQTVPLDPPLRMSVNLSAKQFQQSDLVADVESALRDTGLDASCLELEITESAIMEDADSTIEQLETLKRLGVKLAIDDFGTGYSSLSYIERFPLDVLKIDRSFVSQIGLNGKNGNSDKKANGAKSCKTNKSVVMQAVSTLGQGLGICITAEGIETREQLDHLRELGCDIGQGFLFARPLNGEALENLLRDSLNGNGHSGNGHNGNGSNGNGHNGNGLNGHGHNGNGQKSHANNAGATDDHEAI